MHDGVKKPEAGGSGGALLWGGGAVAGLVAGGLVWFLALGPASEPPPATVAESAAPAATAPAAEPTAPAAEAPAPVEAPVPPAFDTVRADPDGSVLVAGSAPAGANVAVRVDGAEAGAAIADGQGKFAAFLSLGPSDLPRVVTLMARLADGSELASPASVILEPMPAPEVVASAEPAAEPETAAAAESSETATADTTAPAAPTDVLVADDAGVTKLTAPAPVAEIVIDTIGYDRLGNVDIAGRGAAASFARIYVDNEVLATAPMSADGKWRVKLTAVDPGVHVLRIDQLDQAGKVTSRAETPFQREEPEKVALAPQAAASAELPAPEPAAPDAATAAPATDTAADAPAASAPATTAAPADAPPPVTRAAVITVQPGFTLWAIARNNYGDGLLYVRVYEANKDQIRDPDLIYPGQVFTIPEPDEGG